MTAAPDPLAAALAEAVAARLCHDLAGLAGTVAGMLELLDDPDAAAEALPLARQSAAALCDRLIVLRAAWAGDWPEGGLAGLLRRLDRPGLRLAVDPALAAAPAAPGRLLLNVALLGTEALRGRGELTLAPAADGAVAALSRAAWPASGLQHDWTLRLAASLGAKLQPAGAVLRIRWRA